MKDLTKIGAGVIALTAIGGWIWEACKDDKMRAKKEKEREDYLQVRNRSVPVEIVSVRYMGDKYRKATRVKKIQTSFYKSKLRAENELKEMARLEGCNLILDIMPERSEDSEGNYVFSVWRYSGTASKM